MAAAVRWSCTRCGVSVGRIDGSETAFPRGWTLLQDEALCLTCSRARAGEEAIDAAPSACSREERVRMRRKALIEFELRRSPEAANRTIALACRTSSAAVAAVRDELGQTAPPVPDVGVLGAA